MTLLYCVIVLRVFICICVIICLLPAVWSNEGDQLADIWATKTFSTRIPSVALSERLNCPSLALIKLSGLIPIRL